MPVDEAIHKAAAQGDLSGVEALLCEGADLNAEGASKRTPLHCAVIGGHFECAKLLLIKHANPCAVDACGRQPLHYAAITGNVNRFFR